MKITSSNIIVTKRGNERGAALITMLLTSTLLLGAGGALIVATSMSAANSADAVAEMQAYYAAEAGLQATLNALRGNRAASPALTAGQKMDFRKAISLTTSNDQGGGDSSTFPRLSRWLPYASDAPGSRVSIGNGVGYQVRVSEPVGVTTLPLSQEPPRLVIQSTGYGPRGARKQMQMLVKKGAFNFALPATITLAGSPPLTFAHGNSNSDYSGEDNAGVDAQRPVFAVSGLNNQTTVNNTIASGNPDVTSPGAGLLNISNTPSFLTSADSARAFLAQAKELAQEMGRYYTVDPGSSNRGTIAAPAFTFINNRGGAAANFGTGFQGAGLVIVTGRLNTTGATDFRGIILVLGEGHVDRSGGGNGDILGAMVVASFNAVGPGGFFNAAHFNFDGGGTSNTQYDSNEVRRALNSTGISTLGIVEN